MNERIQKLIQQATKVYEPDWNGDVGFEEFDKEKFAELIVRECAGVSENHKGMNDKYFIADAIRQHFGVEE